MVAAGLSRADARLTADVLIRTDMRGIFTHGTVALRRYVQLMRDGGIDVGAVPEITDDGPAWARIDARRAVGMVASHYGMTVAMEKAARCGIGMATVRRSNHFGAASAYTIMAVEHGDGSQTGADRPLIGVAMSNTDVVMNIPGGRGAAIGNNPFSYAVPARSQPPIVLDIAMSTVAGGKVASYQARGEPLPEGWLTDADGLPTTDPGVFTVTGALTPFSAHKGYGLALLVESLSGVLAGAGVTTDILSWSKVSDDTCDEGHTFMAIDVGAMMPLDDYYDRIDELIRRMREAPKAAGVERTYVPGEMELDSEAVSRREGVPLTRMAAENLAGLADDTGLSDSLPFDWP
ncbi:MAG: Ldh family oxidoreductase [Gemmatimonadetes bacterium]|nr:Ldh family oxidoreductase [Gemmatimonadota bacterium]MYA77157.1 Ldh family oxidoreductase [Gemmatimonadota bacterium]MYG16252.1 Ldh family oxidoreductase [Gemmatimonadota bacterium]MYH18967.1 Ldh family oxidoreductase [Gemmatimonadota bacterium]MYK99825.1 Ldh family oxidoreductase [Gemmatimonadota bacterium]